MGSTTTARGLLMPTPGATAMDTVTAMAATDMARGPLMPTPGDTTAVDTDTDTGTVATDMARGLLMLMPGAMATTADMDTDTATAMVAATTVKPSAVLIALLSVLKMSSHHPHLTKYPSHS